jgi:hypothetical protein
VDVQQELMQQGLTFSRAAHAQTFLRHAHAQLPVGWFGRDVGEISLGEIRRGSD